MSDTLFATTRRPDRPWGAVVVSAALHVVVIAAGSYVAREVASAPTPRAARALTFFAVLSAPDPTLFVRLKPLPLPPAVKEPPKPVEPAPALEAPPIPERRPSVETPVEPKPPAPEPRRPVNVEPPKPTVTVGAFDSPAASARTVEPARAVENAGFDAPAASATEMKTRTATVGVFGQTAGGTLAKADSRKAVADAGFGSAAVSAPAQPRSRAPADAGFGASHNDAAPQPRPRQVVKATEFDARPAPPAAVPAPAPREPRIDVQLEILSKPTPAYTDEARTLKIEGDVLLDVRFCASGEIRVLAVVRGLGHGLDESATRAAQGIRFKPAQSAGHAIDFRTTVHIVFRLA